MTTIRRHVFECLEQRELLSISWTNRGAIGNDSDNFQNAYGTNIAMVARQLVDRAIIDWNNVITDQNYDNNNDPNGNGFALTVNAFDFATLGSNFVTVRGDTNITETTSGGAAQIGWSVGVPRAATIRLDDNGGGTGWFFDQTPYDDAEFTAITNSGENGSEAAFQASLVDISTAGINYNDFYRTITHEIGHALGIILSTEASKNRLYNMTQDIGDDPVSNNPAVRLRTFNGANGIVTFTSDGGGHIYEGNANDAPSIVSHPNELLNSGRTIPPPNSNPIPITRQFISDLDAQLLHDAYGYIFQLPSGINTAHATLDSQTGTLLVQGGVNSQGFGQVDTINISSVNGGASIQVRVNGTSEVFPTNLVSQIVIAQNGGADSQTVTGIPVPVNNVQYVVSSNQDSTNAGTLGDGIVDLDTVVPGNQVSLRAAIRDINGMAAGSARSIYVPRGNYGLTISGADAAGTVGDLQGDLHIARNITIIGTGPGETIIDAKPLRDTSFSDRVFDIAGSLNLYALTVTGGRAPGLPPDEINGGGIRVKGGGMLIMGGVAVVENEASTTGTNGSNGGAIYFADGARRDFKQRDHCESLRE